MRTEITDEAYLIELILRIADKDSVDRDFILNPHQRKLDMQKTGRDLVPKARQLGMSSYWHGIQFIKCLKERNTRAVVISHDEESTKRHLARVKYFIDTIRGPKPIIKNMSANEITFPKTNSMFYIGTAGAKKFGRGDTITDLHCSEYAFWPNPQILMAGLLQAVPKSGRIAIESTGNGLNDYYTRCMNAEKDGSRWSCHFFPWHNEPEYAIQVSAEEEEEFASNLLVEYEEPDLFHFGLTIPQLIWRRSKLEELNFDLKTFKQEYPLTLDECFQASGDSIFHKVNFRPTDGWVKSDTDIHARYLAGHPRGDCTYAMGGDVSGGVGKDYSVIEIICCETGEQVYEYTNNKIDPESFGELIYQVGKEWGFPYVCIENNNHGILTLATLTKLYPFAKMYSQKPTKDGDPALKYGRATNKRTKPLYIGRLRADLARSEVIVYSTVLNKELSTFVEHEDGSLGAQDGCHDDTVIALAMANSCRDRALLIAGAEREAKIREKEDNDPFRLENIIAEMRKKGQGFPIPPQHEIDIQNLNK